MGKSYPKLKLFNIINNPHSNIISSITTFPSENIISVSYDYSIKIWDQYFNNIQTIKYAHKTFINDVYVKDEDNLMKSINQIEIFDTMVAFLAGVMIIPAVYVFQGADGLGASGPGLMFVSMPKIFTEMGFIGKIIGVVFFLMVIFAALTSCISIMEAIVSSFIDRFHLTRKKATVIVTAISFVMAVIVCLGYNLLFFRFELPNGSEAQILDIMDYISNNVMMPIVSIATCILIGWIVKPRYVIDEVTKTKTKFGRKYLYIAMVTVIAPLLLVILLLQALGVL